MVSSTISFLRRARIRLAERLGDIVDAFVGKIFGEQFDAILHALRRDDAGIMEGWEYTPLSLSHPGTARTPWVGDVGEGFDVATGQAQFVET